ncbi:surface antigen TASV, putative,mucin-like glycoprotein, putative, partial [Trypanosoma cruzi marinkellei]
MHGEFLCPGADGNLSWRFFGEKDWRKCPNKPGEGGGDDDGCAQVCDAVGKFYESMKDTGMCTPGSNATDGESRMLFQLGNNTKNCSSTVAAQNKDQAVADVTQQLQSHPQAGAAAGATVVNQSQSGVGSPLGEADPAPQKNLPEHAGEGGSDPRPGENMVASPLTFTDAKEHVASASEAFGQSSSSPSGD